MCSSSRLFQLRSGTWRHGSAGKCRTAPVTGSVNAVVTLEFVLVSSVLVVPEDVTVPVTVAGIAKLGTSPAEDDGDWRMGVMGRAAKCDVGRSHGPSLLNTAESAGELTSPTVPRRRGLLSSSDMELE